MNKQDVVEQKSGVLHIGTPRLSHVNGKCRVSAMVTAPDRQKEIYFEFDGEYAPYACVERCDPFVLLLFVYALHDSLDIVSDAPMTERLYYQLTSYQIPVMAQLIDEYHSISILCDLADEIEPVVDGRVAAFSGGVDSFYTVVAHLDNECKNHNLTHLVFNNVGALTKNQEESERVFADKKAFLGAAADELGLPLVAINTNMLELLSDYDEVITSPDLFKNMGCLCALKKLFKIFYWSSSGEGLDRFRVNYTDMDEYEAVNVSMVSFDYLPVYFFDFTASRLDKVRYIADHPVVQKYLSVCDGMNDSMCFKCTRTMVELMAIGKLEQFDSVFDVAWFKKHLVDRLAYHFGDRNEWSYGFCSESLEACKQNGVRIPLMVWPLAIFKYRPMLFLKRHLKNVKFLRFIYDRFDLRTKLRFHVVKVRDRG